MNHHNSSLWKESRALSADCKRVSRLFPVDEKWATTLQLNKAGLATFLAICEGIGRTGNKELAHRLSIARGELFEVEGCLLHALDIRCAKESDVRSALDRHAVVGKLLNRAIPTLKERIRIESRNKR